MNPIHTLRIRTGALAVACALSACTQPPPTRASREAPPAPPGSHAPSPAVTMPDANTRHDTRPSPGNAMPAGPGGGDPADVPPPGPNGERDDDRPLPGTPPLMQY
ncbi:hypothetical protein ACVBGC_23055 [Burkholderia stagnalis]